MVDFFAPATTYTLADPYRAPEIRPDFQCIGVANHPRTGELRALGFYRPGSQSAWRSTALDPDDWALGWTPVPVGPDA